MKVKTIRASASELYSWKWDKKLWLKNEEKNKSGRRPHFNVFNEDGILARLVDIRLKNIHHFTKNKYFFNYENGVC